ncbi:Feline leukemia virus subgroup C receptor-related protein 1 [Manis javanica]|nr:Feline leukemia virus subgroup C receptor-related protein 1 [Manis javanica]
MDEELARSAHAGRLARHLQRLAVPRHDGWQFGLEDGHLDASRLARTGQRSAAARHLQERAAAPVSDAAVALLLDCSGSMKAHARPLSPLVDLLGPRAVHGRRAGGRAGLFHPGLERRPRPPRLAARQPPPSRAGSTSG